MTVVMAFAGVVGGGVVLGIRRVAGLRMEFFSLIACSRLRVVELVVVGGFRGEIFGLW